MVIACTTPFIQLQISMSVNWSYIHVIAMPTALTQLVALSAHVAKALKETDSRVQVNNLWIG